MSEAFLQGSLESLESLEGPDSLQLDDDWLVHASTGSWQAGKPAAADSETQLSAQSSSASLHEPLLART